MNSDRHTDGERERERERERESESERRTETHVLIAHVPVGSLPKGHDLPHDDAEAPDIRGGAVAVVLDGLRSTPQHHTLTTMLRRRKRGRQD